LTSDGSAWYHVGVLPAASEEATSAAKAEEEASAYWTLSVGMACARTRRTDCWTSGLFPGLLVQDLHDDACRRR
jgi:hypothetical protein